MTNNQVDALAYYLTANVVVHSLRLEGGNFQTKELARDFFTLRSAFGVHGYETTEEVRARLIKQECV